jgi:hypothetical protein
MPAWPPSAMITRCPSSSRVLRKDSVKTGSSSTTSMRKPRGSSDVSLGFSSIAMPRRVGESPHRASVRRTARQGRAGHHQRFSCGLRALADHACPGMVGVPDVELRSEERCAVAHRTQAQSRRTALGQREAFAIIADFEAHPRRLDVQCHFDRGRVCVLESIGDRLLRDPKEVVGRRWTEP